MIRVTVASTRARDLVLLASSRKDKVTAGRKLNERGQVPFRNLAVELPDASAASRPPKPWSADLGLMLYDVFDLSRPGKSEDTPAISLFRAKVESGVMRVPPYEDAAVIKLPGGAI